MGSVLSDLVVISRRSELVEGPSDDKSGSKAWPAAHARQEAGDKPAGSSPPSVVIQNHLGRGFCTRATNEGAGGRNQESWSIGRKRVETFSLSFPLMSL